MSWYKRNTCFKYRNKIMATEWEWWCALRLVAFYGELCVTLVGHVSAVRVLWYLGVCQRCWYWMRQARPLYFCVYDCAWHLVIGLFASNCMASMKRCSCLIILHFLTKIIGRRRTGSIFNVFFHYIIPVRWHKLLRCGAVYMCMAVIIWHLGATLWLA
jgi:hypothetical protein